MNARRPYVAGAFYPDDRNELLKMLDLYMSQDFPQIKFKKIIGIIVPHAGYIYSGSTAAYAYNILRGIEKHDFIIMAQTITDIRGTRQYIPMVSGKHHWVMQRWIQIYQKY